MSSSWGLSAFRGALAFCFFLPYPAAADGIAAHRVIRLHEAAARPGVRALVEARRVQVLGEGERFIVIAPRRDTRTTEYEALLEALRRHPAVDRITEDSLAIPMQDTHARAARPLGLLGLRAAGPPVGCRLFPRCGGSNPAWPKLQVGADLAEENVVRAVAGTKGEKQYARIAVVDSGFDAKNQTAGIQAIRFATAKGHATAGRPTIDPEGHGTSVAGMIAGKNIGVTHQLELNVYRVTPENSTGGISNALLAASIEKACEANDVVNVSWGSRADELGFAKLEDELWYKKAVERGCLVIKSSGNSGIQTKDAPKIPLEAPMLTVAASDQFSDEAAFSTTGGIFGPGQGVFSLLSHQHEYGEETKKNTCEVEKNRVGPIDGTSFAAPLVAGVAAQVITILKARGIWPKAAAQKIRLVKSILLASAEWSRQSGSRQGTVNALGATILAQTVMAAAPTDTKSLLAGARKDADFRKRCAAPTEDCTKEKECDRKRRCVNQLRFQFLACVPPPPGIKASPELPKRLFDALKEGDERELLIQLIDRLPAKSPLAKEGVAELDRQWTEIIKDGAVDIGNTTRALNLLHAARRSDLARAFELPKKLRQLMGSYSFDDIFSFHFPIGQTVTQSSQERQAAKFMDIFRAIPEDDQAKILSETPRSGDIAGQLDFLYYLDFQKAKLAPVIRRTLETRMRALAPQWFNGKLAEDFLGVPTIGPAIEALFRYLPDGEKKLVALVKGGLTENNERIFRFAMGSPTALGKGRLDIIEKVLPSKQLHEVRYYYVLLDAIDSLIKDGSPAAVERTVRKVLLENPHATLPISALTDFEPSLTANQKALGKGDFYPKFLHATAKWGLERLKQKEVHVAIRGRAMGNFAYAFFRNPLLNADARKKFLAGPAGKDVEQWFKAAGNHLATVKDVRPYELENADGEAKATVNGVLDDLTALTEAGFQPALRRAFEALKRDVLANPAKYPQSMRVSIAHLYGLKE